MSIKLTQYSHGAGCGCKLSPAVLDTILKDGTKGPEIPQLLVGNDTRDDAAVFDLGDGTAVISTTDFFMPIVDDAFDFGRIASVNAISDVYANSSKVLVDVEGGNNLMYLPLDKLATQMPAKGSNDAQSSDVANQIAREVVEQIRREQSRNRRSESR